MPEPVWRKSSHSGPTGDNCVEVAFVDGWVFLRNSKANAGEGLILVLSTAEWAAFLAGAKDGEFDQP
jgi:uncharacterized protein DUF397